MFKSHLIKSNHRVLRKNEVDTYGAPVFTPVHNTIVTEAKMCTNSIETQQNDTQHNDTRHNDT